MSAPTFGAADSLALGTGWEPIETDGSLQQTNATAAGAKGDDIAETTHNPIQSGPVKYHYTGVETGFIAALLAAGALPGKLVATNTLQILTVGLDYSPCAKGELPIVTFQVHNGPTSAPTTPFWYTSALTLPTYTGGANIIVPQAILTATLGSAEIVNVAWELTCAAGRSLGKTGNYLAGQAFGGRENLTLTLKGIATSFTSTGWSQTAGPSTLLPKDSNVGYVDQVYSFTRKVAQVTS